MPSDDARNEEVKERNTNTEDDPLAGPCPYPSITSDDMLKGQNWFTCLVWCLVLFPILVLIIGIMSAMIRGLFS